MTAEQLIDLYLQEKPTKGMMNAYVKRTEARYRCSECGSKIPKYEGRYPKCLHGSTEIPLLNGTECKIADLVGSGEFWVYSILDRHVIPARALAQRTVRGERMLRVVLDNGESVRCTYDHLWLSRHGEFVRADELHPGFSLMPLYKRLSEGRLTGYEQVYNPANEDWKFTHRIVRDLVLTEGSEDLTGFVVHHRDFDKSNNDPSNLVLMRVEDHGRYHRHDMNERFKEKLTDPIWRARYVKALSEGCKRSWEGNAERKELARRNASRQITEQWKDPSFASKVRAASSAAIKNKWSNDESYRLLMTTIASLNAYNRNANPTEAMLSQREEFLQLGRNALKRPEVEAKRVAGTRRHLGLYNGYRRFLRDESLHKEEFPYSLYKSLKSEEMRAQGGRNHKVVSVTSEPGLHDGYDLTVIGPPVFAISAGVFVHNSCPECGSLELEDLQNSPRYSEQNSDKDRRKMDKQMRAIPGDRYPS